MGRNGHALVAESVRTADGMVVGIQKKEIKNSLISNLCFQNVDRFILTDFGRLFRLSYLEFVSITMTPKIFKSIEEIYGLWSKIQMSKSVKMQSSE